MHIHHYTEAGVERHQIQQHPCNFQHRGIWITVASLPLTDGGRIRTWIRLANASPLADEPRALSTLMYASILESPKVIDLFECRTDGVMIVDQQGKITSVNKQFAALYKLKDKTPSRACDSSMFFEMPWCEHTHTAPAPAAKQAF